MQNTRSIAQEYSGLPAGLEKTKINLAQLIQASLDANNLSMRRATLSDIPAIDRLASTRYSDDIVKEMSHFASYRFVKHGNVFIVEDNTGKIVGCIYEQQLQGSVSFATRLIVDKAFEGLGIPKILTQQTYIAAIDAGSRVRKGIIARDNIPSHIVHLNKLGWEYTGIVLADLEGVSDHFEVELTLDEESLSFSAKDEAVLVEGVKKDVLENRAVLLDIEDTVGIKSFFESYPNSRIVAVLQPGIIDNTGYVFVGMLNAKSNVSTFTVQGINLEPYNQGEPTSPQVLKNKNNTPIEIPQAFLIDGIWRYNLSGMREEARFQGKKVPNNEQWLNFFKNIDGNISNKNGTLMGNTYTDTVMVGDVSIQLSNWWTRDGDTIFLREDLLHPGIYKKIDGLFPIRFLQ